SAPRAARGWASSASPAERRSITVRGGQATPAGDASPLRGASDRYSAPALMRLPFATGMPPTSRKFSTPSYCPGPRGAHLPAILKMIVCTFWGTWPLPYSLSNSALPILATTPFAMQAAWASVKPRSLTRLSRKRSGLLAVEVGVDATDVDAGGLSVDDDEPPPQAASATAVRRTAGTAMNFMLSTSTVMNSPSRRAGPPTLDWGVGHYEHTADRFLPIAERVVDRAVLASGERVVDVGTGTGNAALLAAARGATVTGVDPAERLLDVARAHAAERDLDATFVAGEAAALPLPDAGADVVLSVF